MTGKGEGNAGTTLLEDPTQEIQDLCDSIPDAPGPLEIERNVAFRAEVCAMVEESEEFAQAVNLKCSRDVVFWFNTFVWTQNPKDFPDNPRQPVILFPKQERFVRKLDANVDSGRFLLLQKSREQLASVATSAYALWRLLYRENASTLVGSYKKDMVEGVSYAKAIFPKIDYIIKYLPDRMLPGKWDRKKPGACRKDMSFINPESEKAIEGETCNENFARSGRFAWVWVDEFAHVKKQEDIDTAVGSVTNCVVYTTTPRGVELFANMVREGVHDVFTLHWTDNYLWHPKGYTPDECDWEHGIWPAEWICEPGCKAHPEGGLPHSERYDKECGKYNWNRIKIAQELDINYHKSGSAVFSPDKVGAAIRHLAKPEVREIMKFQNVKLRFNEKTAVLFRPGGDDDIELEYYKHAMHWPVIAEVSQAATPLRVWKPPFSCRDKECACKGTGLHTYVLGGDTSQNVDGDYNCAYMLDVTAGEAVAEWHGQASSHAFGIELAKLCKWYGGATIPGMRHAWHAIENNNNGKVVNEVVTRLGVHGHINRNESSRKKKREARYGVSTTRHNKSHIINDSLQPEIDNGYPANPLLPRLVCPFIDFWRECETYVYKYPEKTENRPENVKMEAQTRKQHDDRVMAMAMAVYGAIVQYGKVRGYVSRNAMKLNDNREKRTYAKV